MSDARRVCSRCGLDKPLEDYRRNLRRAAARLTYCKDCYNKQCREYAARNRAKTNSRARQWQIDNPQRHAETVKRHRDANRDKVRSRERELRAARIEEQRSKERAYYAVRYTSVKDRRNAARRALAAKDPETTRAARRSRYAANKGYYKALAHAHRARRSGFLGRYSSDDIADILRLQRGKCAYCRLDIRKYFEVDHIKPVINQGSNLRRNIQLTCKKCNRSKGKKDPLDYAKSLNRLL